MSCHVANVGTESDAGPGLQGAATRHSVVRSLPENPTIARVALAHRSAITPVFDCRYITVITERQT